MNKTLELQIRRKKRVRAKVTGTEARPRLSVYRSNNHIFAQIINDDASTTVVGVNDKKLGIKGTKTEHAFELGKQLAQAAIAKGIKTVVFDRNGYMYHGRVKAVAEGAREAGLIF